MNDLGYLLSLAYGPPNAFLLAPEASPKMGMKIGGRRGAKAVEMWLGWFQSSEIIHDL